MSGKSIAFTLVAIITLIIFGVMYNQQDYYYKSILKDKENEFKKTQYIIDSFMADKSAKHDTAIKYIKIAKVIEKNIGYTQRQVDSLMDIFNPTIVDSANFFACKNVVVAQKKEIGQYKELVWAKDSIIANQQVEVADGDVVIKQQKEQISDLKDEVQVIKHEKNKQKRKVLFGKIEAIGGVVAAIFLTLKLAK